MNKCSICGSSASNDAVLGEWKNIGDVTVHYFCLLLSTELPQNGHDDDGILGFLPEDIEKLTKRVENVECCFCHEMGASITCSHKSCEKSYHLVCGEEFGCQYKFRDDYGTFCPDHIKVIDKLPHPSNRLCLICHEKMGEYQVLTSIPVCCNEAWAHRDCMRKMAITQGDCFKCPACGDKDKKTRDKYHKMVQIRGVFIPDQDASWEQSPNAYEDLYSKHKRCDAIECLCQEQNGREFSRERGKWAIIICNDCGSHGTHRACRNGEYGDHICSACQLINQRQVQNQGPNQSNAGQNQSNAGPPSQRQNSQGLIRKINSVGDDGPETKKKKKNEDDK